MTAGSGSGESPSLSAERDPAPSGVAEPTTHGPAGAGGELLVPQKKPRKPDRRRALTRRAIVNAAARLFAERGVDVTTVEDIAEAAELSSGTLYFHFGSKENVVLALVAAVLERSAAHLAEARRSGSALERVLGAGDVYLRFAIEQPVAFRFVSVGLPELPGDASETATTARGEIGQRMREFVDAVSTDLQAAMDAGEIDAVPIDEGVAFVWGAWNGVAGLMLRDDEFAITPELSERALARGRSILVRGLGGAPPPAFSG